MTAEKKIIRKELRLKRAIAHQDDMISDKTKRAAYGLAEMASSLFSHSYSVVAGYVPMGNEIDPRPLMTAFKGEGAYLCLPVVLGQDKALEFRFWTPGDMLISGMLGTMHPVDGSDVLVPELVLVPLLGVDDEGVRLGQGGGFYDRTLEQLRSEGTKAFGVCFDEQMVDQLPFEAHDQPLDGLITPSCCKVWDEQRQVRYLAQV